MKRSKHSLSHYKLFTGDMGKLYPVGCVEVLPGDTFQHRTSLLVRVAPMVAPVMHPVTVRLHHWFVPYRIIWDGWEDFITGEGSELQPPSGTLGSGVVGTVPDYLGVPLVPGLKYQLLPTYAYNLIWKEFYRDQDLIAAGNLNNGAIRKIAWEKEYFTSARPWAQKGPPITLPLGVSAPVVSQAITDAGSNEWVPVQPGLPPDADGPGGFYSFDDVYADLTQAQQIDVRDFRTAFALQRYQEARARYGSRYTEYLAYLGVKSSDARLQRPEYLGGGKQTISFSEVLQTVGDESGTNGPLGRLAGHGIAAMRSNRYRKFFEEHGLVVSMFSVRPKAIYSQGLPKKFDKFEKEDYWQRELQHVGAQAIKNKEVYADASAEDEDVFGYQDRYREYREEPSTVAGQFRANELYDDWHMARQFSSRPVLNQSFVECDPTKRIHADQTNDVLWVMAHHSIQARRMVAKNASVGRIV